MSEQNPATSAKSSFKKCYGSSKKIIVENHYHYSLALNYERDSLSITGRPAADQSYEIQTHFSVTVAGFTKGDRLQDLERPKEFFNYLRL